MSISYGWREEEPTDQYKMFSPNLLRDKLKKIFEINKRNHDKYMEKQDAIKEIKKQEGIFSQR